MKNNIEIHFDNALNEAGWCLISKLQESGEVSGKQFNNIKSYLKLAIETYLNHSDLKMNIDKVETQTEHQEEMSAFSGEVEWNGEGLPPVGEVCEYKDGDNWYEVRVKYLSEWFMVIEALKSQSKWIDIKGTELSFEYSRFDSLKFRKPETPQQREGRERLALVSDICEDLFGEMASQCREDVVSTIDAMVCGGWVDKTNYRKGVK